MNYLLQAPWLLNDSEFIENLAQRSQGLTFVSCCPFRRKQFQNNPQITVINPFKAHLLGDFYKGVLWLDQWPSLLSDQFIQLRLSLLGQHELVYLSQSLGLKNERLLLKKFLFDRDCQVLWREKVKALSTLNHTEKVIGLYQGISELGFCGERLETVRSWPKEPQGLLFIPFSFEKHSYLYALSHRHRVVAIASCEGESLFLGLMHWLLGHRREFLVSSQGENQSRRDSDSKDPLSRPSCDWNTSFKKWSYYIRPFLRWSWWREKAQSFNP